MCRHYKQQSCYNLNVQMVFLHLEYPEPVSNVIRLEDDSLNQFSNMIDPATWIDSNFSLMNFNVYTVFK